MEKFYKFTVPNINPRVRIDKYLAGAIENASRTKVQKSINLGFVTVNGELVKSNYLLKRNDEIGVELPLEEKPEIEPEDIPLDIKYEDDYLLVVNKPAGMVVHPAYKNYSGTLVNAIMYYSQQKKDKLSDLCGFERAGIVHRLDKDTSGLIVVAKDEITHRKLAEQFFKHTIEREYNAIVWGKFRQNRGTIETLLGRDKKDRKKVSVIRNPKGTGKTAITHYEIIEEFEYLTLLKLNLETGRTHQIRVHLSYTGHPVFGDETYGGRKPHFISNITGKIKKEINELLEIMPRQALHARIIGFYHPIKKTKMRFESDFPDDMNMLLDKIRINK